jgi:hypothetical protein
MARAEATKRKADKAKKRNRGVTRAGLVREAPTAVFSIPSFCKAHGISESFYHELRSRGLAPDELRVGSRVFISFESAARWRAAREAATVSA